jgi:hypothetical protein
MLMMVVDDGKKEQLEVLLRRSGVSGWTEISGASGMGTTGPRLGSAAFPKTSAVLFTIVDDEKARSLAADLRAYCTDCGERLKMASWVVEELL